MGDKIVRELHVLRPLRRCHDVLKVKIIKSEEKPDEINQFRNDLYSN